MKITDIVYNESSDKATIHTDENYSVILQYDTIQDYNLSIDDELTEDRLTEIIYFDMTQKAKEIAFKYVSLRLRTEKEIRDYLRNKGYDEIVSDNVIEILKKYDYVDDEAYARAFVKDRLRLSKHGKHRIQYELRHKGISSDIIGRVINLGSGLELENAVAIIRKKLDGDYGFSEKRKVYQHLARKGYSNSVIEKAFYIFDNES